MGRTFKILNNRDKAKGKTEKKKKSLLIIYTFFLVVI